MPPGPGTRHQAGGGLPLHQKPPYMKLRLIEQRLRLLLHGARWEAASRCVLVSAAGTRVEEESACRQ